MRPNHTPTVHNSGSSQEDVKLSLDVTASAHLISVLTNLYSDPITAVIREYSTNALDSHIEAGNSLPIQVTLPTHSSLFFKVRDFGLGLNVDGLRDTYSLYGRSTKRESDAVNGLLGLGCKSGLTYGNSFNVTAVQGGVKTLATVVKDDDGVGVIRILDTSATTEPNGVEIAIPVKSLDIRRFTIKAAEFYHYWRAGTVEVDGAAPETIWDDKTVIWLDDDVAVTKGSDSFVVQHNVAYPVKYGKFDVGVVAFVPVGSVNFTPSREALHYTTRTEDTINTLVEYVAQTLPKIIEQSLVGKTPWEKLVILNDWRKWAPKAAQDFITEIGGASIKNDGGRAIWRVESAYNYRSGNHKAAKKMGVLSWFDMVNATPVITGFTAASISNLAKARLADQFDQRVLLLPSDVDPTPIAGRPNTYTWAEIIAKTEHVKKAFQTENRGQTEYTVRHGERVLSLTAKELAEEAEGETIVYVVDGPLDSFSRLFPQVFVVALKTRSYEKFVRLFPNAVSVHTYKQKAQDAARKALTADDKLAYAARYSFAVSLSSKVNEIKDPELVRVIKVSKAPQSAAAAEYIRLGGSFATSHDLITLLTKRYPLLHRVDGRTSLLSDFVLYINAKFETIN